MLTLGHLTGSRNDIPITGVVIDSRQAGPGSAFYAFCGEQVDGHDYVGAALDRGAAVAFVERDVPGVRVLPPECAQALTADDLPVAIRVPSSEKALQQAAARYRATLNLDVVGVTGSVGKTTAKEAVAAILSQGYPLLKSVGNANNELGLPLTLLSANDAQRVAVLEMGMYALGEIALLCELARPRIGLVTNVQPVHLERLGSLAMIARAKGELIEALPPDGVAVLNGDDAWVAAMAAQCRGSVVTVGSGEQNQVRIVAVQSLGIEGSQITVELAGLQTQGLADDRQRLHCRLLGRHTALAAAMGAVVGLLKGLDWSQIQAGLDQLGYGPRLVPRSGRGGITILDDAYNASPSAVAGALEVLSSLPGRHIAVLGDMLELGAAEEQGHMQVGRICAERVDVLITRGERAGLIARAAREAGMAPEQVLERKDNAGALAAIEAVMRSGDTILVKGSRGMMMEEIVAGLLRPVELS